MKTLLVSTIFIGASIFLGLVIIAPVYKKLHVEITIASHNKINNDNSIKGNTLSVTDISELANTLHISIEVTEANDSNNFIRVKATGGYQQLIQLITELIGKSSCLFILWLTISADNLTDSNGQLNMNASFGSLS